MAEHAHPGSTETDAQFWTVSTVRTIATLVTVAALAVAAIALLGWVFDVPLATSVRASYLPMPPATGVAVLALALALLIVNRAQAGAVAARVGSVIAAAVAALCLVVLAQRLAGGEFFFEHVAAADPGFAGGTNRGRMSPVTAATLAAAAACLILILRARTRPHRAHMVAANLSHAIILVGAVVVAGYAFGAPFGESGTVIPPALSTGAATLLLGLALWGSLRTDRWPVSALVSPSVQDRLLRVFPPLVVAAVFFYGGLDALVVRDSANPALMSLVVAVVAAAAATAVGVALAARLARQIDRATTERERAEAAAETLNVELEVRVFERTVEVRRSMAELETFSYSISHDLRGPLRAVSGFAALLGEDYGEVLDERGLHYCRRIHDAGVAMGEMMDDLLELAQLASSSLDCEEVDLSALAQGIGHRLRREGGRETELRVEPGLAVRGDPKLLGIALQNLLANACKFSSRRDGAVVEFASRDESGERVFFVRDNGAGFDMAYVDKLFAPFQRLHRHGEFDGYGMGLAIVRRVIERHGGRVWAEGAVDAGATFSFTLGPPDDGAP